MAWRRLDTVPAGSPGIYDLDAGAFEAGYVASRQRGALGAADGRDQRVEAGDGFPGSLAAAGDDGVVFCGCGVDRQNLVFEGREDIVGCGEEDLLAASVRQPGDAVPDLCEPAQAAETSIRYGGTGGIGYYHISDTYIALFSRFIPVGEAVYLIQRLLD